MESLSKGKEKATDDGFFMERLEILYEQSLGDLRAFAEREGRAYEEVKRRMAELHCKSLFDGAGVDHSAVERNKLVSQVLQGVSRQLESLETLVGLQSFFLVVNPNDQQNEGFLGGTLGGREFWRGHRGCGVAGAQSFKAQCVRSQYRTSHRPMSIPATLISPTTPSVPELNSPRGKVQAREVKTQLYGAMRDALRATSGIRNAEMKWTNHSKLQVYGVRIVGWPDGVPQQNPSTFSVAQNKLILDLLNEGKLSFVRTEGTLMPEISVPTDDSEAPQKDEDAIFEDSIDYSWVSGETDDSVSRIGEVHSSRGTPTPTDGNLAWDTADTTQKDSRATTPKRRRIDAECS